MFANAAVQRMRRKSDNALKRYTPIVMRGFENQRSGTTLACSMLRLHCALTFPIESAESALSGAKFNIGPIKSGYTEEFARSAYEETS